LVEPENENDYSISNIEFGRNRVNQRKNEKGDH